MQSIFTNNRFTEKIGKISCNLSTLREALEALLKLALILVSVLLRGCCMEF